MGALLSLFFGGSRRRGGDGSSDADSDATASPENGLFDAGEILFPDGSTFFTYFQNEVVDAATGRPIAVYLLRVLFLRPQGQFALKIWQSAKVPAASETPVVDMPSAASVAGVAGAAGAAGAVGAGASAADAGASATWGAPAGALLADSQYVLYGTWRALRGQRLALKAECVVHQADGRAASKYLAGMKAFPYALTRAMTEVPTRASPFVTYRSSVEFALSYDTSDDSSEIVHLARVTRLFLPSPVLGDVVGTVMLRAPPHTALAKVWPTILPPGDYAPAAGETADYESVEREYDLSEDRVAFSSSSSSSLADGSSNDRGASVRTQADLVTRPPTR